MVNCSLFIIPIFTQPGSYKTVYVWRFNQLKSETLPSKLSVL